MVGYELITVTIAFMGLDIVSGFLQAVVNKCIDSQVMKMGLFHKCGFILAIVLACLCEFTMQYIDMGFTIPLAKAVCGFIIATEIISNLENIAKISPELSNSKFMSLFQSAKVDNDRPTR